MADKADPLAKPRRFYKAVDVAPADAGGWAVRLDGRTPRSPQARPLVVSTEALARLVAEEWDAQSESIDMETMRATRLAYTALDGVSQSREAVAAGVGEYAETDLVCYFAAHPTALIARQAAAWTPLIAWADDTLGLSLERVDGVMHRDQPEGTADRVAALALQLDDFGLAALSLATGLFGSAVIALALSRGRLTADQAFGASRIDETFQEDQWGVDAETAPRTAKMAAEAQMLARWFTALR